MTTKKDLDKVKEAIEAVNATSNYFTKLAAVDCSGKIEKKNGLSYLSWAWAWGELKKRYPASYYTIYENKDGLNYHTDGKTAWVKTGVTLVDSVNNFSLELIEYLPVMDYKNNSIPLERITSFDVNKAIQRSLTKAIARHGLGLYIDAGEDLPEETAKAPETTLQATTPPAIVAPAAAPEIKAPAKPTTAKKPNPIRAELVELCKANPDKIDFQAICKQYKLNNSAPDSSFEQALNYVKFCLRMDDAGLSEYPEEV
jgi:hypothetical protein